MRFSRVLTAGSASISTSIVNDDTAAQTKFAAHLNPLRELAVVSIEHRLRGHYGYALRRYQYH